MAFKNFPEGKYMGRKVSHLSAHFVPYGTREYLKPEISNFFRIISYFCFVLVAFFPYYGKVP